MNSNNLCVVLLFILIHDCPGTQIHYAMTNLSISFEFTYIAENIDGMVMH